MGAGKGGGGPRGRRKTAAAGFASAPAIGLAVRRSRLPYFSSSRAALERSRGCGGGSPCACIPFSRLLSATRLLREREQGRGGDSQTTEGARLRAALPPHPAQIMMRTFSPSRQDDMLPR